MQCIRFKYNRTATWFKLCRKVLLCILLPSIAIHIYPRLQQVKIVMEFTRLMCKSVQIVYKYIPINVIYKSYKYFNLNFGCSFRNVLITYPVTVRRRTGRRPINTERSQTPSRVLRRYWSATWDWSSDDLKCSRLLYLVINNVYVTFTSPLHPLVEAECTFILGMSY